MKLVFIGVYFLIIPRTIYPMIPSRVSKARFTSKHSSVSSELEICKKYFIALINTVQVDRQILFLSASV